MRHEKNIAIFTIFYCCLDISNNSHIINILHSRKFANVNLTKSKLAKSLQLKIGAKVIKKLYTYKQICKNMRYKMNKPALLRKMAEYGQTIEQRIAYMQHNISVLMTKEHFLVFNSLAHGFNIYYMLLNQAFELLRLNYSDYMVIIQSTEHEIVIEIRKKGVAS